MPEQTDDERRMLLQQANESKEQQIDDRRKHVLNLARSGKSQPEMADELGVSISTIKRDLRALNGQVKQISQNYG